MGTRAAEEIKTHRNEVLHVFSGLIFALNIELY